MKKEECDAASLMWEYIGDSLKRDRQFAWNITMYQAMFCHEMGYKWKHDELLCHEHNGKCEECPLAKAGQKCRDVGSWWSKAISGDASSAYQISSFYRRLGNDIGTGN